MQEGRRQPLHSRRPTATNGPGPRREERRRTYLLRSHPRPRFEAPIDPSLPRIRRERRVNGSFSGIPELARNGTR